MNTTNKVKTEKSGWELLVELDHTLDSGKEILRCQFNYNYKRPRQSHQVF